KGDYSLALRLNEQMAAVRASTSQNELTILARAFMHMARTLEEREGRLLSQAERLQAANAQLQALQSLTDVALSDLGVDLLVEQLLQRVIGGIGARSGAVFLADTSNGRLEPRATVQPQAPEENGQEHEWAAALAARVVTAGQLTVCDNASQDPDAPS